MCQGQMFADVRCEAWLRGMLGDDGDGMWLVPLVAEDGLREARQAGADVH